MMTGHGTIDSALEAMKRGASDYLTKPLNLDELIVRLAKGIWKKSNASSDSRAVLPNWRRPMRS